MRRQTALPCLLFLRSSSVQPSAGDRRDKIKSTARILFRLEFLRHVIVFWALSLIAQSVNAQLASADVVRAIARVGQDIAIGSTTYEFSDFAGQNVPILPVVGPGGHIALVAFLRGPGVTSSNSQTMWLSDQQGNLSLLFRPGMPAPALEPGILLAGFSAPSVNQRGDVASEVYLSGSGVISGINNRAWIVYRGSDGFQIPARMGEDLSAQSISANLGATESFRLPARDPGRHLFVKSSVVGGAAAPGDKAIFLSTDSLSLIVRKGDPAPGFTDVYFADPDFQTNESGQSVVFSHLFGPGVRLRGSTSGTVPTDQAIWKVPSIPTGSGSLTKVARTGDPALGVEGQYFHTLLSTAVNPQMNTDGDLVFSAHLATTDGAIVSNAIWSTLTGSLELIALSGMPVPGAGSGVVYSSLFNPLGYQHTFACDANPYRVGSEDSVVFIGKLSGSGVNAINDRAVFRHESGQTRLLLRGGFGVMGTAQDVTIVNSTLGPSFRVNRYGTVAANVQLAGPSVTESTDRAVVSTHSGLAQIVAREGQVVEGTEGFAIVEIRSSAPLWQNARGQIVFTASLARPSNATDVRSALLRVDETGQLRPIAVSGEILLGRNGPTMRNGPHYYSTTAALSDSGTFVYIDDLLADGDLSGRSVIAVDIAPSASGPACPADFNSDGAATVQDIFDFLALWFAQDTRADFNNDSTVTVQDLFDFLNAWFAGC